MPDFLSAIMGGGMIGASAVMLMAGNGKIMGVSGIISRLLPPSNKDWEWRIAFLGGVLATPCILIYVFKFTPQVTLNDTPIFLILAGLLVGAGTVIGNGCTSGHGVCGIPRLSMRSIIATMIFMATAIATVSASRIVMEFYV